VLAARAVLAACSALEAAQEELCRLDSVAGDGDEGFAMAGAARGIRAELAKGLPEDVPSLLKMAATRFSSAGGTMGALCFVLINSLGQVPGLGADPLSAAMLAELLAAAEDSVCAFGGAKRGDKTIVDAIAASRDEAQLCVANGESPAQALVRCSLAAEEGAATTAGMVARIGRASRFNEQSRGTVDPGAQSFAIVLSALATTYASATREDGMQARDDETAAGRSGAE
jgi:dihydroxyacetone kinase